MARRSRKGRDVHGIIALDKPVGLGSNEALQVVKRLFQARKAGHTGSLDRLASGVLPICFGEATKVSGFLLNADKRYSAVFKLGEKTRTGDAEGDVTQTRPVNGFSADALERVLEKFRGEIEQVPPMHSAIKHQGQRLYKLAHQGLVVTRKPRMVVIHDLKLLALDRDSMKVDVTCSKGTYVRTLAEDIGDMLGCGAHVSALRRTAAGPFNESHLSTLEHLQELAADGQHALDGALLPMEAALSEWPRINLTEDVAYYLGKGQAVMVPHAPTQGWVRLYGPDNDFLGVGEVLDDGRIAPRRLVGAPQKSL